MKRLLALLIIGTLLISGYTYQNKKTKSGAAEKQFCQFVFREEAGPECFR